MNVNTGIPGINSEYVLCKKFPVSPLIPLKPEGGWLLESPPPAGKGEDRKLGQPIVD